MNKINVFTPCQPLPTNMTSRSFKKRTQTCVKTTTYIEAIHQQLVGGWTNPSKKICSSKMEIIFPNFAGWTLTNIWSCHHHSTTTPPPPVVHVHVSKKVELHKSNASRHLEARNPAAWEGRNGHGENHRNWTPKMEVLIRWCSFSKLNDIF